MFTGFSPVLTLHSSRLRLCGSSQDLSWTLSFQNKLQFWGWGWRMFHLGFSHRLTWSQSWHLTENPWTSLSCFQEGSWPFQTSHRHTGIWRAVRRAWELFIMVAASPQCFSILVCAGRWSRYFMFSAQSILCEAFAHHPMFSHTSLLFSISGWVKHRGLRMNSQEMPTLVGASQVYDIMRVLGCFFDAKVPLKSFINLIRISSL